MSSRSSEPAAGGPLTASSGGEAPPIATVAAAIIEAEGSIDAALASVSMVRAEVGRAIRAATAKGEGALIGPLKAALHAAGLDALLAQARTLTAIEAAAARLHVHLAGLAAARVPKAFAPPGRPSDPSRPAPSDPSDA